MDRSSVVELKNMTTLMQSSQMLGLYIRCLLYLYMYRLYKVHQCKIQNNPRAQGTLFLGHKETLSSRITFCEILKDIYLFLLLLLFFSIENETKTNREGEEKIRSKERLMT